MNTRNDNSSPWPTLNGRGGLRSNTSKSKRPSQHMTGAGASIGWWFLGFFFPLVGFILWIVWLNSEPAKSRRAGWGALISMITSIVLYVFVGIAIASVGGM